MLLLDMLRYPEGPRFRDRISHGEIDLDKVDLEVASHILNVCAAFACYCLNAQAALREVRVADILFFRIYYFTSISSARMLCESFSTFWVQPYVQGPLPGRGLNLCCPSYWNDGLPHCYFFFFTMKSARF